MKTKEVVEFIEYYTKNDGFIQDKRYLQTGTQLKLKWVDITHSLDALSRKLKLGNVKGSEDQRNRKPQKEG